MNTRPASECGFRGSYKKNGIIDLPNGRKEEADLKGYKVYSFCVKFQFVISSWLLSSKTLKKKIIPVLGGNF